MSAFFPAPACGTATADLDAARAVLLRAAGWNLVMGAAEGQPAWIVIGGPFGLRGLMGKENGEFHVSFHGNDDDEETFGRFPSAAEAAIFLRHAAERMDLRVVFEEASR